MKNEKPFTLACRGIVLTIICVTLIYSSNYAQDITHNGSWYQYVDVEEAGFSHNRIDSVKNIYDNSGAASLLVVSDGKIVMSLGDNTRRYMVHSIRKSFMSALIGMEVEKGTIDLSESLNNLGIDDIGKLTEKEKKATVKDLLCARSGIYHPSAYSPRNMIDNLPARESFEPGAHWYYNNWDFNTLVAIFNQETGKEFFKSFVDDISEPLGMEDFRMGDTFYRYEKEKSDHPAYLFKMSARDMARFGMLYLNQGKWEGIQMIPEEWINESTSIISNDLGDFGSRGGYGMLWWVGETLQGNKMYYASGLGGHRIVVLPDNDMVIVIRVNTYENKSVRGDKVQRIIEEIIAAKNGIPVPNAMVKKYAPSKRVLKNEYSGSMDRYLGEYMHRALGEMSIKKDNEGYFLQNNVGVFRLYLLSEDKLYPEDLEVEMKMVKATEDSKRNQIEPVFNSNRSLTQVIFYY